MHYSEIFIIQVGLWDNDRNSPQYNRLEISLNGEVKKNIIDHRYQNTRIYILCQRSNF
jgi:hypothetical protein